MSKANGLPEWIPLNGSGTLWHFVSRYGKRLGIVTEIGLSWYATKHCQPTYRRFDRLSQAKAYAETSLRCVDCLPKIEGLCPPESN